MIKAELMPAYFMKCFGFNATGFSTAPLETLFFPQAQRRHPLLLRRKMSSSCMKEKPSEFAKYYSVQIYMFSYNTKKQPLTLKNSSTFDK